MCIIRMTRHSTHHHLIKDMLHPAPMKPHELRVSGIMSFGDPLSPGAVARSQMDLMDAVLYTPPIISALPRLKVVEAHVDLAHPPLQWLP